VPFDKIHEEVQMLERKNHLSITFDASSLMMQCAAQLSQRCGTAADLNCMMLGATSSVTAHLNVTR
jgi:hypothetical protein